MVTQRDRAAVAAVAAHRRSALDTYAGIDATTPRGVRDLAVLGRLLALDERERYPELAIAIPPPGACRAPAVRASVAWAETASRAYRPSAEGMSAARLSNAARAARMAVHARHLA